MMHSLQSTIWHSLVRLCLKEIGARFEQFVSAFTVLRVYAIWERDWRPLIVVVPLSLARPLLFIVSCQDYEQAET